MRKRIKTLFPIAFIGALVGASLGAYYTSHHANLAEGRCYFLLKASYQGDQGMERLDTVITLSFLGGKGVITANAALKTAEGISIPLLQRMNFNLTTINDEEMSMSIVSIMNRSLSDTVPSSISPYMLNMLKVHLISPGDLKFRILPEEKGSYLIMNNQIPWAYCNSY